MRHKQILTATFFVTLLLLHIVAISALTAREAKQNWIDSKQLSKDAQQAHREAKQSHGPNSEQSIDTGKESLHAALNEAEFWLIWKQEQTNENSEIPNDLRDEILEDIETNKAKIEDLRAEVDTIENNLGLAVTFLRMIGKYTELLTDVARDSGKIWIHIANKRIENLENYESKLRETAENRENTQALAKLDLALKDIEEAKTHINAAETNYNQVQIGGTPLIKFHEGNKHLREGRTNLLKAHTNLNQALGELLKQ